MSVIQSRTRVQIRTSILRALGGIAGTATGTQPGDTASLIDTFGLQGADDEHNGKSLYMTKTAGAAATDKTWVTDYAGSTHDATLSPVVSGIVAVGDTYELYPRPFLVEDVNDAIDRAIIDATRKTLVTKQTTDNFTRSGLYEYAWLTNFKSLHSVEYVSSVGIDHLLSDCETVWTAGGSVTATADSSFERLGTYCAKLVVGGGAAAGAVLGYINISEVDISDCDRIEFDMYSSIALTAGYLDFVLDDTAACVSPVESIDIPAMTAATWYRHSLSLANPHSDTAIISLGVVNTTDVGACTLYFDNIHAVKDGSKVYKELNPQHWEIVRGSTNYLKLTESGLSVVGANTQIRLNGYQLPTIMTADTETCTIDPEYIVEWVLAYLMLYHAKSRQLDIDGRADLGKIHLTLAEQKKQQMSTVFPPDIVFI